VQNIPDVGATVGGKYRVLKLLGQGGMGAVLEAEHEITKKRVAIKWMHPQIASDADAQARFVREAQASARVRHPNIVDVYDVVREGEAIFLVMELLEGETLTALLRRGGTPIHKLIELLLPALRAVAAAHRQGVIHRDLKPDNIFLAREADSAQPVPKVLDFGISKVADSSALTLTRTGAAMGTPMYMSLEQLCGEKDLDGRTDVYALGVILYEAVTGRAPFSAETFSELAIKVATVEPPGPKQIRPELPGALASLIAAAMTKKREQRLSSVDELIQKLEPFASEQSFRAKMTHANQPIPAVPSESASLPSGTIPLASARPVEASPTYSRSQAPDRSGTAPSVAKPKAALYAFAAAALLCVTGLGVSAARYLGAASAPTAPVASATQSPAAPPAASRPPALPEPAATAPSASADASIDPTPTAAPLAPKARQRAEGKSASATAPSKRSESDVRAPDANKARRSVVKRAGPARMDDF
jgi:serine/threonine-protein kinase